jgi:hypothetical protein
MGNGDDTFSDQQQWAEHLAKAARIAAGEAAAAVLASPPAPPYPPAPPPEIAKAIVEVEGKIKRLAKDDRNKFQNYKFTSVDAFYEAVGPLMAEAKIFSFPHQVNKDVSEQSSTDDRGVSKKSMWLSMDFDIFIYHETGAAWGPFRRSMRVPASGAQAFGSSDSYVQKQYLRTLFKIPTGDADDADHYEQRGLPASGKSEDGKSAREKEFDRQSKEDSDRFIAQIKAIDTLKELMAWDERQERSGASKRLAKEDFEAVGTVFVAHRDALYEASMQKGPKDAAKEPPKEDAARPASADEAGF